jgi:uncharacterized NAD-dependent epimerase/dehydratase family protein
MTLADAKAAGAKTLVIGVANRGGMISQAWKKVLVKRWKKASTSPPGCTTCCATSPTWPPSPKATGRALHDVRVPEVDYPIANGKKRTGKRCWPSAPIARSARCTPRWRWTARCGARG